MKIISSNIKLAKEEESESEFSSDYLTFEQLVDNNLIKWDKNYEKFERVSGGIKRTQIIYFGDICRDKTHSSKYHENCKYQIDHSKAPYAFVLDPSVNESQQLVLTAMVAIKRGKNLSPMIKNKNSSELCVFLFLHPVELINDEIIEAIKQETNFTFFDSKVVEDPKEEMESSGDLQLSSKGNKNYSFYTFDRLTKARNRKTLTPATRSDVHVVKEKGIKFKSDFSMFSVAILTQNAENKELIKDELIKENNIETFSFEEANELKNKKIQELKASGYVSEGEYGFIPFEANLINYDFNLNKPKITGVPEEELLRSTVKQKPATKTVQPEQKAVQPSQSVPKSRIEQEELFKNPGQAVLNIEKKNISDEEAQRLIDELLANNNKNIKTADDNFSQFFSGEVPEYMANLIGTSNVDISRISPFFSGTSKSVDLVNQFDSNLLKNISVIFNSADSGSYGVYVPSLDRAIKTNALKKQLEQKGYEIKDENGVLVAYPTKDDKTRDQIKKDIDVLYKNLESKGGTIIGVNMQRDISVARENASKLNSPYPNLWELLAVVEVGATIAHEARHAQGGDEGASQATEDKFVKWCMPKVNEEYKNALKNLGKEDQFSPLILKRSERSNNWYKTAKFII